MKDQYDQEIPSNLLVLSCVDPSYLSEGDLEIIRNARWYDASGFILVPFGDVDTMDGGASEQFGFPEDYSDLDLSTTQRISGSLYRWSDEDGFYHA